MKIYFSYITAAIVLAFTGILTPAYGQWQKHEIDIEINKPVVVCAADIDDDIDLDLIAAGEQDDDVIFYENLGGTPISWTKHTIDGNLDGANDIITADIDGDSYQDVIVTGFNANKVVWYNNLLTDIGILSERVSTIYELFSNFPNPFNPSTKIKFALPKPETVTIEVYNIIGQKIQTLLNKPMPAGYHEVEFNGQNLSSGIYLYRIETGQWQDIKKMVLIR